MKYLIVLFITSLSLAAPIKGNLLAEKGCKSSTPGQLFISENSKLIYQIELPHSGSFKVDLPPGKFKLSYIMKNGCSVNQTVTLKDKAISLGLKVRK
jgi:hypothetical protein